MNPKPHIFTDPQIIRSFLRMTPAMEFRWPASYPKKGWIVVIGNNPHHPGHTFGDYWLGATHGRDENGTPYSKENPCYMSNLFDEKGDFRSPVHAEEGFVAPAILAAQKDKKVLPRLLLNLRREWMISGGGGNRETMNQWQIEACDELERQIQELEERLENLDPQ